MNIPPVAFLFRSLILTDWISFVAVFSVPLHFTMNLRTVSEKTYSFVLTADLTKEAGNVSGGQIVITVDDVYERIADGDKAKEALETLHDADPGRALLIGTIDETACTVHWTVQTGSITSTGWNNIFSNMKIVLADKS